MNLKYILIVWGAMLFCVGCSEDDVDSSYSFDVAGLKATVTNDKGSVVEMNTILLDSLQQQGFVGEVSFSEETRAENDRLAEEKFAEKLENIKNIKPARLLQLLPGERVMVTFDYLLGIIQVVTKIRYTLYNNYLPTEPLDTDNNPFPTTR